MNNFIELYNDNIKDFEMITPEPKLNEPVEIITQGEPDEIYQPGEIITQGEPDHLIDISNCSICLENYSIEDLNSNDKNKKIIKTDCNHYFHEHCIISWLINKNTCPYCRSIITNNIVEMMKYSFNKKVKSIYYFIMSILFIIVLILLLFLIKKII